MSTQPNALERLAAAEKKKQIKRGRVDLGIPENALSRLAKEELPEGAITAQDRARMALADIRGEQVNRQRINKLFERQRELVGGGNPLTTGLVSPETVLGAMTGLTEQELADLEASFAEQPGTTPMAAGGKRFLTGVLRDLAGLGSAATSPVGIATAATAPFSGPAAAIVRAGASAPFAVEGAVNLAEGGTRMMREPLNPEAVQQTLGGGAALAGGMAGPVAAARLLKEPLRVGGQRALGIDQDLTLRKVIERNAKQEAQEAAHQRAVLETMLERGETVKAFQAKKLAQEAEFRQKIFENLLERLAVAKANEASFNAQIQARNIKVLEQNKLMAQRVALEEAVNRTAMNLRDNARITEQNVKSNLDQRYAAIREAVGDSAVSSEPITNAVRHAETGILQGSGENIKVFREIMEAAGASDLAQATVFRGMGFAGRQGGTNISDLPPAVVQRMMAADPLLEAKMQSAGFGTVRGAELGFRDAHGFYSELGRKLFSRERLPGDVYRALKHVHDEIGRQLQRTAEVVGQGEAFRSAQADWSNYMKTFHDMRAVARGGSPVARLIRAEDPGFALDPIVGKAAGRATAMLRNYQRFGAQPELALQLLRDTVRLKNMPTKAKEIPEVVRKDKPLPRQPEAPPPLAPPRLKELPPKPEALPRIDAQALKRIALEARAKGIRLNHWDWLAIGTAKLYPVSALYLARHVLRLKSLREFLSKPTAGEVELTKQ